MCNLLVVDMAVEAAADSWTGLYLYLLPKPQAKGVVLTWASDALGEYGGPLQPTMANYWKEEPERQVQVLLGLPLVGRALEPLQGHAARAGCSLASTACSYQSALGPVGCTASLDWVLFITSEGTEGVDSLWDHSRIWGANRLLTTWAHMFWGY